MSQLRFGEVQACREDGTLLGPAGSSRLTAQEMSLLLLLASKPGDVFSRDAIHQSLWAGTSVSDEALTALVSKLRSRLEAAGESRGLIETLPKRGYRLKQNQPQSSPPQPNPPQPTPLQPGVTPSPHRTPRLVPWLALALVVSIAMVITLTGGLGFARDLSQPTAEGLPGRLLVLPVRGQAESLPGLTRAVSAELRYLAGRSKDILVLGPETTEQSAELTRSLTQLQPRAVQGLVSQRELAEALAPAREVGADWVLWVSINASQRTSARLLETATGRALWVEDLEPEAVPFIQSTRLARGAFEVLKEIKSPLVEPEQTQDHDDELLALGRWYLAKNSSVEGLGRASALFEEAAELAPNNPDTHELLARSYLLRFSKAGEFDVQESARRAQPALQRALLLDPRHVRAHTTGGMVSRQLGHAERAEASLRLALRYRPEDETANFELSELLLAQGRLGEALILRDRVLRGDPLSRRNHSAQARILSYLGRFDEADERLVETGVLSRELSSARIHLLYHFGRWQEARELAQTAFELWQRPADSGVLAKIEAGLGNSELAYVWLTQHEAQVPGHHQVHMLRTHACASSATQKRGGLWFESSDRSCLGEALETALLDHEPSAVGQPGDRTRRYRAASSAILAHLANQPQRVIDLVDTEAIFGEYGLRVGRLLQVAISLLHAYQAMQLEDEAAQLAQVTATWIAEMDREGWAFPRYLGFASGFYALTGETERARRTLERALEAGFKEIWFLDQSAAWDTVRTESWWPETTSGARADLLRIKLAATSQPTGAIRLGR